MQAFRESLDGVSEFKEWFEYADELVKYGLETLDGHPLQLDNRLQITASALFVRAHKSFQAALILSKDGLLGDARAVIRSATEGALALYAISTKPDFIDKLVEAKHYDDRKKARVFIGDTDFNAQLSPEDLAGAKATIKFVSDLEAQAGYDFRDVKWAEVAKMKDTDGNDARSIYDLLYRSLSSDGTHTTIDAIWRVLNVDSGKVVALKIGPDISNLIGTLASACNVFLWSAVAFNNIYGAKSNDRIQMLMKKFESLNHQEPLGLNVTEAH